MGSSTSSQWRKNGHPLKVSETKAMLGDYGKILVTGGAGFIGSHLVGRLLRDGADSVVVMDNLHRGRLENLEPFHADPRLQIYEADVRNPDAVADAMQDVSLVYHLAAQSNVIGAVTDMDYCFSTNVVGTYNVLRAASRRAVRRVIFSSSREVYGEPISLPVDEGDPLLPVNSYGASKLAGEAYCRAFRHVFGLQTVVLRLANVYGQRDTGRVIPLWLEQAAAGEMLPVYGGKQLIDFVWIDDTVEALIRAAIIEGPLPPINVASGTGTKIIDLARRISRLTGGHGQLKILPARPVEVTRFVASVDRMREILGIEPPLDPLVHLPSLLAAPVLAGV
jgi:UDP-glucose 4-epimerase